MIEDFVGEHSGIIGAHLYVKQMARTYPGPSYRYFRMLYYTRHQFAVQYIINWIASDDKALRESGMAEAMLWKLRTPRFGVNRKKHAAILTKNPHDPIKFKR